MFLKKLTEKSDLPIAKYKKKCYHILHSEKQKQGQHKYKSLLES